jgi:3-hydroxyacyl-[acyl-carrier-protein] dehydratase
MTSDALLNIDIDVILKMLPHRYPFLMVDRVVEFTENEKLWAYKNVTFNEPFFQGHFPNLPVMPGVLMLEAMAQAGGLLLAASNINAEQEKLFMFTGLDKVKFRRPVRPGDRLDLYLDELKSKMNIFKMRGKAMVDGQLAAEANLSAALVSREDIS